jgi:predicted nucleic acid-binding protein
VLAGVIDVVCLDAGVWVKALAAEELSAEAAHVLADSIGNGSLVAPAFCWAEVGSVLRKKARARDLSAEEAADAWTDFRAMPVTFIDTLQLRSRAWDLRSLGCQGTLSYAIGDDLGLRDGNWSFAIVSDHEDRNAYRAYDRDVEHNRLRARLAPMAEQVARAQFEVAAG